MYLSSDVSLRLPERLSRLLLVLLLRLEVDIRVACGDDSVPEGERPLGDVVEQGLLFGISEDTEPGLEDCLRCGNVPHFISRYEIQKEVAPLVGEMQELVSRSLDSVDLLWLQVRDDILHQALLLIEAW